MLSLEHFIADCVADIATDQMAISIAKRLAELVSEPEALRRTLSQLQGFHALYRSQTLTILNLQWQPGMSLPPHEHRMWACVGIYQGLEHNQYWSRGDEGYIRESEAQLLAPGEVALLDADAIHSVENPTAKTTAALHIYGGDFFRADRSEWPDPKGPAQPYDLPRIRSLFSAP